TTAIALFRSVAGDVPAAPQLASAPAPVTAPLSQEIGVPTEAPAVGPERGREAAPRRADPSESIFGAPTQMVSAASIPGEQAPNTREAKPADAAVTSANPDQPINIKLDLTITDQVGGEDPVRKVMSMIVADGLSGTI